MNQPLISIITACFNSASTIQDTLESVVRQNYRPLEFIVVDGASDDATANILASYNNVFEKNNIEFKWISEKDTGVYNAWNKALNMAHGDWLVFIGADDFFKDDNILERVIPYLTQASEKNVKFVYGKIEHITKKSEPIEVLGQSWDKCKNRFKYIMNVGHSGSFNHNSLFEEHGNFDETFQITGDYEFLLREYVKNPKMAMFIDDIILVMRQGGLSSSLSNRLTLIKETKRARKLNHIHSFSPELFFWEMKVRFMMLIAFVFGASTAAKTADLYRQVLGKNKRWNE